ncbi:MAG TPA: ATP-binding protein [Planctomycetaceae bacterium]|nr:ATP-binding protein [Planctomycetaceae bacterium]
MQAIALAAGLGLTVDSVLLVALAEGRNRRVRQGWMIVLALSAWCWHAGAAVYFLLEDAPESPFAGARWFAMTLMVVGLLGMPCSLMHAVVRLATTGWFGAPQRRGYEPLLYAPVLLVVPIASSLQHQPALSFLAQVEPLVIPYLAATTAISILAAVILWRASRTSDLPAGRSFLRALAIVLIVITVTLNGLLLWMLPRWPDSFTAYYIILVLLPLPPALLFAYFVLRYGFLPLVLERTVVYGGIIVATVLMHRSMILPIEAAWGTRFGIDLLWLEVAVGGVLILGYQPLRRRVREAMRYLTSTSVRQFRREVRELSVELAARGGHSPHDLANWMVSKLCHLPGVAAVQIFVEDSYGKNCWRASSAELLSPDLLREVMTDWTPGQQILFADQAPSRRLTDALLRQRVTLLIRTEYEGLKNLWALRINAGSEGWDEEELTSLVLLSEQAIAAVRHGLVQEARASAERRAWQAEKLSALGLLAGSLAHEIKNPLSSIKTLTSVAIEECLPGSEQAESLRLVLQEIDRLSRTTHQLLGFVRSDSPAANSTSTDVIQVLTATVQIIQHRARQQQVELTISSPMPVVFVPASREALQSIVLNLLLNAVEACRPGGAVRINVSQENACVQMEVRDNGVGIPVPIQDQLFEPLVTTKADGTGLGLYLVAQTLRDLDGEIAVESVPERGTVFRVTLPAIEQGRDGERTADSDCR